MLTYCRFFFEFRTWGAGTCYLARSLPIPTKIIILLKFGGSPFSKCSKPYLIAFLSPLTSGAAARGPTSLHTTPVLGGGSRKHLRPPGHLRDSEDSTPDLKGVS